MPVPRSLEAILEQADELAARFENHEPRADNIADATALRMAREAFQERVAAERRLAEAVATARADGHSWAMIGAMVGTSGEAARQKYKQPVTWR
jgi:hypothetical protein